MIMIYMTFFLKIQMSHSHLVMWRNHLHSNVSDLEIISKKLSLLMISHGKNGATLNLKLQNLVIPVKYLLKTMMW